MNYFIKNVGLLISLLAVVTVLKSNAQVKPTGAQFFFNQQSANPAMLANEKGLFIDLGYRQQSGGIDGAPKTQTIMGSYRVGQFGLGLNVNHYTAGLMRQTSGMASMAYHLPVGANEEQLSVGVSFGVLNDRINTNDLQGEADDEVILQNLKDRFEVNGDIGLAYTDKGLNVQGAIRNFRTVFDSKENRIAGRSTFFTALSYRFKIDDNAMGISVEPKIAYRGVTGFDNVTDVGAALNFLDGTLGLQGIYHSYKAFSAGVSGKYKTKLSLLLIYSSQPGMMSEYQSGDFELALKFRL